MSAPPPELAAYHLGIVVRDIEVAKERYQRMLGIDFWADLERRRARPPWRADYTDVRLNLAFGRAAGLTIELIQVTEGKNQHTEYLEAHGEGAQHIGFWTPDLRGSVEGALAAQGLAYVDPGVGSLQFEFVGSSANMPSWLGADFERVLVAPPWEG